MWTGAHRVRTYQLGHPGSGATSCSMADSEFVFAASDSVMQVAAGTLDDTIPDLLRPLCLQDATFSINKFIGEQICTVVASGASDEISSKTEVKQSL